MSRMSSPLSNGTPVKVTLSQHLNMEVPMSPTLSRRQQSFSKARLNMEVPPALSLSRRQQSLSKAYLNMDVQPSLSLSRRQLLQQSVSKTYKRPPFNTNRAAEVCGSTAAGCAAVWCCCPCGLVNILWLAVYKLPAGLCRRAIRRHKRHQLLKRGLVTPRGSSTLKKRCPCGCEDSGSTLKDAGLHKVKEGEKDEGLVEFEDEMWKRFYGTGFWRSPSQREALPSPKTMDKNITPIVEQL